MCPALRFLSYFKSFLIAPYEISAFNVSEDRLQTQTGSKDLFISFLLSSVLNPLVPDVKINPFLYEFNN